MEGPNTSTLQHLAHCNKGAYENSVWLFTFTEQRFQSFKDVLHFIVTVEVSKVSKEEILVLKLLHYYQDLKEDRTSERRATYLLFLLSPSVKTPGTLQNFETPLLH